MIARILRLFCGVVLVLVMFSGAHAQFFDLAVALTPLGGDDYRYDFSLYNVGPARDAIFKWTLDNGRVGSPSEWVDINFDVPFGWWAPTHNDHRLDFQTGNGSYPADGFYRIYGQAGAPVPASEFYKLYDQAGGPETNTGYTMGIFSWTFHHAGGPIPTVDRFMPYSNPLNVKVHFQPIGENWENIGDTYVGTYVPEPSTLALLGFGLLGLGGFARFRFRK